MLIESLEIEALGPFREKVALGPFAPGLNILAQPNEWGKSTVVQALCRALFDSYRSESEEIRQMRPAGTTLSPRIELAFTAGGARHRLSKRFLEGRASQLQRWDGAAWVRTDESERADQRVRELLGAQALGNRKSKSETWGLIRYLWCRQDEPTAWPCWEGETGETARRKLATVEIDGLVRNIAARLECRADALFTSRGVKKNSPLEAAGNDAERLSQELAALQGRQGELEALFREFAEAQAELPRLEREAAERLAEVQTLQAEVEANERHLHEFRLRESELKGVECALQSISADRATLTTLTAAASKQEATQEQLRQSERRSAENLQQLEEGLSTARGRLRQAEETCQVLARQKDRWRALADFRAQGEQLRAFGAQRERVAQATADLAQVQSRLEAIAPLSDGELKEARKLDRQIAEKTARLASTGLTIRLSPAKAAHVSAATDGASQQVEVPSLGTHTLRAARRAELELPGWGRVTIESGAAEPAELQGEIAALHERLSVLFAKGRAASLAEAESAVAQAAVWRGQVETAQAALKAHLGESRDAGGLLAGIAKLQGTLKQTAELHHFTPEELASTGQEPEFASLEKQSEEARNAAVREISGWQNKIDATRRERSEFAQKLAVSEGQAQAQRDQADLLRQRYAAGPEAALLAAQLDFTRGEARLAAARSQLPPEAEKLPDRLLRARRAASAVELAWQEKRRRVHGLRVLVEERGGEGLYTRLAEVEAQLENARARVGELRREGLGARLLGELIRRREQSSIQAVLRPLEDRLSQTFAALSGRNDRRVWFDEHLAVAGIGPRREEIIRFDDLSRGAREQLLLALRAAIALEVSATEGPQCLILDDVLVHTDAARHENVLGFLESLAGQVQIVLLTCHAERYRGFGQPVPVTR